MKRKFTIAGMIAVVIAAILGIWLLNRPEILCSMKHTCSAPETSVSSASFSEEAGGKIKILFSSDIKSGDLKITLYDSTGDVVKELGQAKELQTFLISEHSDAYTLEAACKSFIGSFKIAINKAE